MKHDVPWKHYQHFELCSPVYTRYIEPRVTCATGVVCVARWTVTGERVDLINTGSSMLTWWWRAVVYVWCDDNDNDTENSVRWGDTVIWGFKRIKVIEALGGMFLTCATGVVSISRCTATGERVDSILTGSSVLTRVWGTVVDVWGWKTCRVVWWLDRSLIKLIYV